MDSQEIFKGDVDQLMLRCGHTGGCSRNLACDVNPMWLNATSWSRTILLHSTSADDPEDPGSRQVVFGREQ